jgi:hypothetical protein
MSVLDVACTAGMKEAVASVFPEVLQPGSPTYYLTTTPAADSAHVTAASCFVGTRTAGIGRKMVSVVWLVREGRRWRGSRQHSGLELNLRAVHYQPGNVHEVSRLAIGKPHRNP